MYRYTCLNPIAGVGLNRFSEDYVKTEDIKEADAVLVLSANMHEMELPDTLQAIARAGAGVNNIPLEKCAEQGIVVFNTPGANAVTHLGMEGYGYDPYISVDAAWNLSRSIRHINDVNEIYEQCDYITIHVPLLDSTKKMIGKEAIGKMKKNVVILNYARDLLVDEEAVIEAIEEGRVHRYVSDFPNPVTVGKKGVILTPHLGASTIESEDNCAVMAVKELMNFLENGNIRNSVNYPNCDLGLCTAQSRLAIYHRNVKKMIGRFADILSDTNIKNMSNTSKGDYAYTLLDLDARVSPEIVEQLRAVEGVVKVRVVK